MVIPSPLSAFIPLAIRPAPAILTIFPTSNGTVVSEDVRHGAALRSV